MVPDEACGEFDTPRADPNYPEWTCANLAEAFPGPMTPLSQLDFTGTVHRRRPSGDGASTRRTSPRQRPTPSAGHLRPSLLPERQCPVCDGIRDTPDRHRRTSTTRSTGSPTPKAMCDLSLPCEIASATSNSQRPAGPRLAGIGTAVSEVERHAGEMAMGTDALAALSDERLNARIETLWDDCIAGWKVGLLCTFLVSAPPQCSNAVTVRPRSRSHGQRCPLG